MKRLKKLASSLPNSSKLSSLHISKIKGGVGNAYDSVGNDKRDNENKAKPDG